MFLFRRRPEPVAGKGGTAVVLDVETTGLNPYKDEVVELAMILFRYDETGRIDPDSIEEYTGLREPSVPISPDATRIHGLRMEDVVGRRLDEQWVRSLASRADFFIAHNVRFDKPFVERLFPSVFRKKPWLCTCHDVDWSARGLKSKNLGVLAEHHRIPHENAHRALGDARATLALLSLKGLNGGTVLTELVTQHKEGAGRTEAKASTSRSQS